MCLRLCSGVYKSKLIFLLIETQQTEPTLAVTVALLSCHVMTLSHLFMHSMSQLVMEIFVYTWYIMISGLWRAQNAVMQKMLQCENWCNSILTIASPHTTVMLKTKSALTYYTNKSPRCRSTAGESYMFLCESK